MTHDTEPGDDETESGSTLERARATARACIEAGIEAADPITVVEDALAVSDGVLEIRSRTDDTTDTIDLASYDRVVVFGGGNAAGRAASALETVLGAHLDGGIVVTDTPGDTTLIEQLPGDHPLPSPRGVESTRRLLEAAEEADEDTLALVVVTGGGSALMAAPAVGVDLADLQGTTDTLLRAGAPIADLNAVRKHLSDVKGGRLAAALAPARVVSLVFSDVVGNPLDVIASGPTSPDPTTYADALDAIERHDVDVPDTVMERLHAGARGSYVETPPAGSPVFDRTSSHVLADNLTACAAARRTAIERGYESLVLTTRVTGSARTAGEWHAAIAQEVASTGNPLETPAVVVSGGETTVRVTGDGRGGPNQEFVVAAAMGLPETAVVAAVDTDGLDGNSGVAGALADRRLGDDGDRARAALDANDTHPFLAARDSLIDTGVTGTNVNDLRVLVVEEREATSPD